MKQSVRKPSFLIFAITVLLLIPFFMAAYLVLNGNTNFWYDPARDFLLARDNLDKLTLIGPTTGIPGFFYGPYWIWMLSLGMFFTLDPKTVIFCVVTIPYFTLFPYILFRFRKIFDWPTVLILWTMYIFGAGWSYTINPWNPHPAPMIFLTLVGILVFLRFDDKSRKKYFMIALCGFLAGLLINFHVSFGLGVYFGVLLYLGIIFIRSKFYLKRWIAYFAIFAVGTVIAFLPFLLFEIRHGFMQIQTAMKVFTAEGSVVAVTGLSDAKIVEEFFNTIARLFNLPFVYALGSFLGLVSFWLFHQKKKKHTFTAEENNLWILILSVSASILTVYLTAKNPVWEYHFIGVEIIFLLLLGLITHKSLALKISIGCIALYVAVHAIASFVESSKTNPLTRTSLVTKEYFIRTIHKDAENNDYTVYAYSPSIYTYEYSYLLKWIANKDVPYDPGQNTSTADIRYLIIPKDIPNRDDFIESKSPKKKFKTTKLWEMLDGTTIVKRTAM